MYEIQPRNSREYPFDFLRIPLHGAANKKIRMTKATGGGTALQDGDTVYAETAQGLLVATADDASGESIGTAVGNAEASDDTCVVQLSGNDAVTICEYRKNRVRSDGAMFIAGTVTNIWDNPGWITPSGDNGILITDQFFDYLFEGAVDSLCIMWREIKSANQAADRYVMQAGSSGKSSPGGFAAVVRSTAREFEHWPSDTAGDGNVANKAWNTDDTEQWFAGLFDYARNEIMLGRDGNLPTASLGNNNNLGAPQKTRDLYPFQGTASNRAVSFLAGNSAAGALENFLNQGSGDIQISDIFIARDFGGYEALLPAYAEYVDDYYEKRLISLSTARQ